MLNTSNCDCFQIVSYVSYFNTALNTMANHAQHIHFLVFPTFYGCPTYHTSTRLRYAGRGVSDEDAMFIASH